MEQHPNLKKKRINIWLPLIFSLVMIVGMLLGFKLQQMQPKSISLFSPVKKTGKIEELIRYIEAKYVENVDRDKLIETAISSTLKELDPHSNYIPAKRLQSVTETLQGEFEGIGIEFYILNDTIMVVAALTGGPSDKVGIMAGDKIVEVEDTTIAGIGITNKAITEKLRGKKGTDVNIGILRRGESEVIPFTITRDKIPIHSLDAAYMLDKETGYFKLNRFSATTHHEFRENLERLVEKENLKDVIIDVRQNPGGYLLEAKKILSELFEERQLMVYTEGRSYSRNNYESSGRNRYNIRHVAILIDEGSASASEIIAGAIQDWDRGVVVGRRSFGKGLVQEQYKLSDGSALRLTVARYYTPSGRCIQKPYDSREDYVNDVHLRIQSGELENQDSIDLIDSTRYYTSRGRIVYGGGGIIPDEFVPIDQLNNNEYYIQATQHIPNFVYQYLDNNRAYFESFKDVKAFDRAYKVDSKLLNSFTLFAKDKGLKMDNALYKSCKQRLALRIKASFARQLFQEQGFFQIWNQDDPILERALEVIRNYDFEASR